MTDSTTDSDRLHAANELAVELATLIRRAKDANLGITAVSLEFSLSMLDRERYRIKTTN